MRQAPAAGRLAQIDNIQNAGGDAGGGAEWNDGAAYAGAAAWRGHPSGTRSQRSQGGDPPAGGLSPGRPTISTPLLPNTPSPNKAPAFPIKKAPTVVSAF